MLGDVQASFIHNTGLLFIMTNQNTDLGCVIVSAFLLRVFDLLSVGPQHPQCTLYFSPSVFFMVGQRDFQWICAQNCFEALEDVSPISGAIAFFLGHGRWV